MSGASDKARFYLEQSVPELQELERKQIFSKDEISAIARKRADFEHKLNARGARPADFAQYAEYEMNLEALRRKRVRRSGAQVNPYSGQRRIFFVLDRATRKFHGDVGLWMQYAEYARREKANRKFVQIVTAMLRLHPTNADLWVYAATYALDVQGDMTGARTYMQRGLRFCKRCKDLWIQYGKLEMIYLGKIEGRRQVLGIDHATNALEADGLAVQTATERDTEANTNGSEQIIPSTKPLHSSPALSGAIPLAIFDAAMQEFPKDELLAARFFDLFAEFPRLSCTRTLLQHAVTAQLALAPQASSALACSFRLPLIGIDHQWADFPAALRLSFERLRNGLDVTLDQSALALVAIDWLLPLLKVDGLDDSVRTALGLMLRKVVGTLQHSAKQGGGIMDENLATAMKKIASAGFPEEANLLRLTNDPNTASTLVPSSTS
ncbi:MAG: cytosolic factor, phosphatidylinositol/phosphatidylcholine transfer protein [Watsoniomyces obsoletus]|nr:MAG: cytosolic factor, phosphatidylinositol/phosphatidylcholine transfer protein [Watsoniomyces obsoletus]